MNKSVLAPLYYLIKLSSSDVNEELDDYHDHDNEIDKKVDEARGAKLEYNLAKLGDGRG
jgi:hypothetical protein